jgi:hypothetical protein
MKFASCLKILLLCSLLPAAACGLHDLHSSKKNGNAAGSGSANSAAPSAAPDASPIDAMTASIQAQLDAKSYRARMESSYEGTNSTRVIEYVAPDRFRMTGDNQEMIITGSNTYMKLPNGRWQKMPMDANKMISSFRDPKLVDELRKSTDAKFLGVDTIDGTPVRVYQYTVKNAFGTNLTSVSKAWVAASDNLPRKMEVEGNVGGKPSKTLITYYDYNADIKIDPPM